MRRDFTAISALSMVISFMAAVVLCLQIAQLKSAPEWQISGPTAWIVEIAIFGTAVYIWRPGVALLGWVLGIAALISVRLALVSAAGLGLMFSQGLDDFAAAVSRTSTLGPRLCAAVFSLMVFYPLRLLLPVRSPHKTIKRSFADSAAASPPPDSSQEGDPALVLVGGTQTIPVWDTRPKSRAGRPDIFQAPTPQLEGSIELPLRAMLNHVPQDLLSERQTHDDSSPVSIPLEVILPQLKEARILVSLGSLQDWLPPGTMQAPLDADGEDALVQLPLDLIIPQLPPEAFELPPPSLPAWATAGAEVDSVSFATT